jgi:hypothetical protein
VAAPCLPSADAERLARLLGMLGSEHDGEAANAGRLADRLVCERGLTWRDIILGGQEQPRAQNPGSWQAMAGEVLAAAGSTEWERAFAEGLLKKWRGPVLTPKQWDVLTRIYGQRCVRKRA